MHDEVMKFIDRFTQRGKNQGTIDTFTCGCCYWFAFVLMSRFDLSFAALMYDEVINHFGCRIDGRVYDITGDVTDQYNWEHWIIFSSKDRLHHDRIIRDCVNF